MDLSWESLYAQFPGLSSPAGCDDFNVDLFFEKNDKPNKNKDAVIEEYVPDNALVYMEETLDLDKLTELSSLTSKDITNETSNMVVQTSKTEVNSATASPENCSALYYYNYDESSNVQCASNRSSLENSNHTLFNKSVLNSNINLVKLAEVLPPGSEEFLQNLLYESEANTFTSTEEFPVDEPEVNEFNSTEEFVQLEPLTPSSPLAVVPRSPAQVESDDESKKATTVHTAKQRILLPKGTIAYTLDLIPGTNTYMVTESTIPVPENTNTSIAGTLSNNDLISLGISSTTTIPEKMDETSLDFLQVPYQSPAAASPKSEASWSGNNLQVSYSSPTPSPFSSSSSDTEWTPASSDWEESRGTPYGKRVKRSPEERKARKMEQNKTAALRYRQKKHKEINNAQIERDDLHKRNVELKKTASDLSTELKYIKKLLKEVCQAKGLLQ